MGDNGVVDQNQEYLNILCEASYEMALYKFQTEKNWPKYYKVRNTTKSFKKNQIVRCTLNNVLYKVYKVDYSGITIAEVTLDSEFLKISPKFLEKVKSNKNWIKVLYE